MDVNLYIERLILDGIQLDRRQRRQLQAAVESELARLLAEGGVANELRANSHGDWQQAPPIQLTAEVNPSQLGTQVAQAVYSGLVPGPG